MYGDVVTQVVKCPICNNKRTLRSHYEYFRCCGVMHDAKQNLLGSGITKKPKIDVSEPALEVESPQKTKKVKIKLIRK